MRALLPSAPILALPLAGLALATGFVLAWGFVAPDIALGRAHATAWASAALALPALVIFAVRAGRRPLGAAWRLWWTAGWLLVAIHLWWGLGRLHDWNLGSVFARQGLGIAVPIVVLEVVWAIDVVLAWSREDWALARGRYLGWQWLAWWIAVLSFAVSLAVFQNSPASTWIGAAFTGTVGLALLRRLAEREAR